MIRRRLTTVLAAMLGVAAPPALPATLVVASPPITIATDSVKDSAAALDSTPGIMATCTIGAGPISNIASGYRQPDAFTAMAVRIPPCAACPSPQTLDLKTVSFSIFWVNVCTAQAEVSVVRAVVAGGCLAPDPTQGLCGPVAHAISGPGPGPAIHTLPIPTGCCVSGDAFVLVRFIGLQNCSASETLSPLLTRTTTACVNCEAYFTTAVRHIAFTDWCAIVPNGLWWRLEADCCSVTGIGSPLSGAQGLQLTVAPNPATVTAELMFEVSPGSDARLEIFDLAGRRCAMVAAGMSGSGRRRATWRGELDTGGIASPGIYRARLTSREGTLTRHILWLPK